MERLVICMKWGTLYPAEYVNILYRAVQANLSLPHRFVCLTDDPAGLLPEVEALDLPRAGIPDAFWTDRGIWGKLALFQPDLHGLKGRALFLDLDMLIVGSLDDFFEYKPDAPFVSCGGGPQWRRGSDNPNPKVETTVFTYDIGAHGQILSSFLQDPEGAKQKYTLEQTYVEATVGPWVAFPDPWIVSFKRHLRQPLILDRFKQPFAPGPQAKCVSFHGKPDPWDLVEDGAGRWAPFPHYGKGRVDWVRENLVQYGFKPKS